MTPSQRRRAQRRRNLTPEAFRALRAKHRRERRARRVAEAAALPFTIVCPTCSAPVGASCCSPGGGPREDPHLRRVRLASGEAP